MKVVIRVDASLQIGTGHVMRCLTLAEALKLQGVNVDFICRPHKGNLFGRIEQQGFQIHELPLITKFVGSNKVVETNEIFEREKLYGTQWLGSTQQQDAEQCKPILDSIKPDWVIIDHYAIDQTWQALLKESCKKIMVIDDLADRKHQCDILLDQTYGRKPEDYIVFVPKNCQMLLGTQYALLRPEFAQWREYSLKRRANPEFKKLLITMGGVDPDNFTGQVLDMLRFCKLPKEVEITVVMGATAPYKEAIKNQAEMMPYKTQVKTNVNNMAEIMANADFAIGAAGATTWERCCLGLPGIQMVIADNQIEIVKQLNSIHAIKYLKAIKELTETLESFLDETLKISLVSSCLVDGRGANRVVKYIVASKEKDHLLLEPLSPFDSDFIYSLQTKQVRKFFRYKGVPSLEEHESWFNDILKAKYSQVFIITLKGCKSGMLRVDGINNQIVEISIIISPAFSGQGLAKKTLKLLVGILLSKTLKAVIHGDNIASQKIFEALGFKMKRHVGVFSEYFKYA